MSGNVRNRTQGNNSQNASNAGAPVFRAKAKPKVSPLTGANFDYSGDPRIGESFVVVIAGPDRARTITFHHPIGVTDLEMGVWVATPTSEVPDLVARRDDPAAASIRENREEHRFESAVAAGLVTESDDGEYLYPSGENRQAVLSAARAAAKAAAKAAGTKPAAMAYLAHLSADRRVEEDRVRDHLTKDSVVRASVVAYPDSTYRTRSGPLADRAQRAHSRIPSGVPRAAAEDMVSRILFG